MDYQEFLKEMQKKIKEALPERLDTAKIVLETIKRNNNTLFEVMSIKRPEDLIASQFYMKDYYRDYQRGKSMDDIANDIVEIHLSKEALWGNDLPFDVKDYNQVRDHLIVQVINKETNDELLGDTPHNDLEHTNLTAICRVNIDDEHSFVVKDHMLSYWDVSQDVLFEKARANTIEQNPFQIMGMLQAAFRSVGMEKQDSRGLDMKLEPSEMYVLTNQTMKWGASAILYQEVLKQIAENAESNYFILPSSIHEILVIRDTGAVGADDLQMMVMNVNDAEVSPEEILANDVYYYDKDEQMLSMATSREQTAEMQARFSVDSPQIDTDRDTEFER